MPAEIVLVVSNVADAPGLDKARGARPAGRWRSRTRACPGGSTRRKSSRRLREAGAEWVCLAGYMRLLSPGFIAAFRTGSSTSIPACCPPSPGSTPRRRPSPMGSRSRGCTVHLVDEGLDSGPIVVQRTVPVEDGDTPGTLAARILEQEHQAYPEALRRLLTEPWRIEGRRLLFLR